MLYSMANRAIPAASLRIWFVACWSSLLFSFAHFSGPRRARVSGILRVWFATRLRYVPYRSLPLPHLSAFGSWPPGHAPCARSRVPRHPTGRARYTPHLVRGFIRSLSPFCLFPVFPPHTLVRSSLSLPMCPCFTALTAQYRPYSTDRDGAVPIVRACRNAGGRHTEPSNDASGIRCAYLPQRRHSMNGLGSSRCNTNVDRVSASGTLLAFLGSVVSVIIEEAATSHVLHRFQLVTVMRRRIRMLLRMRHQCAVQQQVQISDSLSCCRHPALASRRVEMP